MKQGQSESTRIKVASYGSFGRLITDGETEAEEVVVAFQGIICRKDLPLVVEKIR